MKRIAKVFVLLVMLTFLMEVSLQTKDIAKANWIVVPGKPITVAPAITVESPKYNESYIDVVPVNFTITQPIEWEPQNSKPFGGLSYVNYTVDGGGQNSLHSWGHHLPVTLVFNFSITNLASGNHTITIFVGGKSVYAPASYVNFNGDYPTYEVNSSASVSFRVTYSKEEQSPTVSIKESTTIQTILIPVAVAIVLGVALLVYLKKHRH
jgi:hypothetical protein